MQTATSSPQSTAARRFSRAAWSLMAYNVGVVLWGAWVRITGSGAGCGRHWPTCHGEIIPRAQSTATFIEFTHRVTSGLTLVFSVLLLVWARRIFASGHPTRVIFVRRRLRV